jgi:anti-sigma factor RsiW
MLHDIVAEELERHFSQSASRAFYEHLDVCEGCRQEVSAMEDINALVQELRSEPGEAPEPLGGFYNRVADRVVETQRSQVWGLLSPGVVFFRRVAFASLLLLAGLGSFLVIHETGANSADAVSIMAQHDPALTHDGGSDRDHMLVTLASYHE